ncbi:MAG: esterase/lipase family protein [Sphingomonadaceae bacterium]
MATAPIPDLSPPPLAHFLREAGEVLLWPLTHISLPPSRTGQEGEGRPVLVIPGFLASDASTNLFRRSLEAAGYRAHGWNMGRNMGARPETLVKLKARVDRIARRAGRPVILIGWSLGGLFARELAKLVPDRIDRVITLGSPFSGDRRANNVWRLYEWLNDHRVDDPPLDVDPGEKPPVPTIAFWSQKDGIVAPGCARGEPGQCDRAVELDCTHMGFVAEAEALNAVLDAMIEKT